MLFVIALSQNNSSCIFKFVLWTVYQPLLYHRIGGMRRLMTIEGLKMMRSFRPDLVLENSDQELHA